MTATPLLMLSGIEKSYTIGKSSVCVLNGVDLTVDTGDFVVISGDEGPGQSALLNILAGIEKSSHGEVILEGQQLHAQDKRAHLLGSVVSFLSPVFSLVASLTIHETVNHPNLVKRIAPELALELAGIDTNDNRRIHQLDQESRRRVGTACAFIAKPKVLLADLTPPPWGVAPTLESLSVANQHLGSAVIATSRTNVGIPICRAYSLREGKIEAVKLATC